MLKEAYVAFIYIFIACWAAGRMVADREIEIEVARWKPPKALRFFFAKRHKVVTLHNLVYMAFVIVLGICFQPLFFYWWSIDYADDAVGLPYTLFLGMFIVNATIYGIGYYLDYRRKSEFMRRKNRYKF